MVGTVLALTVCSVDGSCHATHFRISSGTGQTLASQLQYSQHGSTHSSGFGAKIVVVTRRSTPFPMEFRNVWHGMSRSTGIQWKARTGATILGFGTGCKENCSTVTTIASYTSNQYKGLVPSPREKNMGGRVIKEPLKVYDFQICGSCCAKTNTITAGKHVHFYRFIYPPRLNFNDVCHARMLSCCFRQKVVCS